MIKLLGIFIDSKLTFQYHLRHLQSNISQKIGIVRKCLSVFNDSDIACVLPKPLLQQIADKIHQSAFRIKITDWLSEISNIYFAEKQGFQRIFLFQQNFCFPISQFLINIISSYQYLIKFVRPILVFTFTSFLIIYWLQNTHFFIILFKQIKYKTLS